MNHFQENYQSLTYPRQTADSPGFYRNQLGAIHAVAAHFTTSAEPAIICMPTGSGKTAVLVAAPYVLSSTRVLVMCPSKLVRNQAAREFATLGRMKAIGALPRDLAAPKTIEVRSILSTLDSWEALREADVVVATPNCVSPEYENVTSPPPDMFDLILVDEAHHAPARPWNATLGAFPRARQVLFTATPYRRDRREIRGRIAYTYSTKRAYQDGVFGSLRFRGIDVSQVQDLDRAIAREVATVFAEDRARGKKHFVLVRARSKQDTVRIHDIYNETALRLGVVHSGQSQKHVDRVLKEMTDGSLDGVIAVDMLSEGVDFPRLKIAAIHSPHRSLPVTLQFVGRFARTNDPEVGEATFVGPLSEDMEKWFTELYSEDAIWREIVPAIADSHVEAEAEVRRRLEAFDVKLDLLPIESSDVSLYAVEPFHKVSVWRCPGTRSLASDVRLPGLDVLYTQVSEDKKTLVIIAADATAPRWDKARRFVNVEYQLFVAHVDPGSELLFIHSTKKAPGLESHAAEQLGGGAATLVPFDRVKRALRRMVSPKFSNVGMRNVVPASASESYVIRAGTSADRSITGLDARGYNLGHVMGSGLVDGTKVARGISSRGKIWEYRFKRIPEFVDWCDAMARELANEDSVVTGTNLDLLSVGEEIRRYPSNLLVADWPADVYRRPREYIFKRNGEFVCDGLLSDLDLRLDRGTIQDDRATCFVEGGPVRHGVYVWLSKTRRFSDVGSQSDLVVVDARGRESTFVDYLSEHPLVLYCADFAYIGGSQLFRRSDIDPFPGARVSAWDWSGLGVSIIREAGDAGQSPLVDKATIHGAVASYLSGQGYDFVIYDHGSGEIADFVCMRVDSDQLQTLAFYHCKASDRAFAGARVDDVYEVCGQVAKSVHWINRDAEVLARLKRRAARDGWRFVHGSAFDLTQFLETHTRRRTRYEITVVQPGVSRAKYENNIGEVFGAADAYILRLGCEPLRVFGSD